MTAVLQLSDVTRVHGEGETEVHALRGISFAAHAGELVAIMGPSGSGKSTLLTLAGGLDSPTSGTVAVEGTDLASLGAPGRARMRRTSLGYVFQDFNLIPALTAAENVALPLELDGRNGRAARALARTALEEVGIGELADRFPDQMSGGQQQRVAIARAVVGERRLVLADEPTGALDTETGEDILRLLRARCDAGAAGVLVTHEARHAAWADRVVFLRDGVVVDETGADQVEALVDSGRHPMSWLQGWLRGWRLPLRIARRDALRHRGRSVLVLVMIALPVLAVTAADVLLSTSQVTGVESIDRRMGASQALVTAVEGGGAVQQAPDPDECCSSIQGEPLPVPSAEQVSSLLDGARLVELRTDGARVTTANGVADAEVLETDLADPATDGLVRLESGRLPSAAGEVVVNQELADKGYAVGDTLDLAEVGTTATPPSPTVVGIAESTTSRSYPFAAGPLGSLGASSDADRAWLVDGGPVTWASVKKLNEIGATVASRAVIEDPPPSSERYAELSQSYSSGDETFAIVALIVTMALLEVVLLAGPAFAVGARKQQRALALMAASGGTPAQSRRVIMAGALVLGGAAAVAGVVLGIGVGRALAPLLQPFSGTWFGPFEVPWLHLVGVVAFGLLSALLAAMVPAAIASRQDVVAVLAGRRGDRPASLRSPLLGVVLLGVGVAASVYGAVQQAGGELFIAAGAIPAVLGMILLVPLVLTLVAKVAGRLPLALRYAVRDADRHRTRTVPAVAAVAATVAGVVTLSIALTSDQRENEETYVASLVDGTGIARAYDDEPRWDAFRTAIEREIPGATVTEQRGLSDYDGYTEVKVPGGDSVLYSSGDALGANVMVSDGPLPVGLSGLSERNRTRAEQVLAGGGMVAFTSPGVEVDATTARLVSSGYDPDTGEANESHRATVPATYLPLTQPWSGPAGIVSTPVAQTLGVAPRTVALAVSGAVVSEAQEEAVNEALGAVDANASLYVERGFQPDDAALIAQLILVALGGVLMLGGTLTATFLALSDARPDLATLAAVGASPRTRRAVAAAYAVVVGGVGALLGAAVGFIPGLAITWPLTAQSGDTCVVEGSGSCVASGLPTGPFIDVPWLMILGLVVVLPAVTALVVGAFARSRLPLVARLD